MACSATSLNFYLPPRYETPTLDVNIKEPIFIRVNNPTLNRNIGKYNLATYGIGSYLKHLALL